MGTEKQGSADLWTKIEKENGGRARGRRGGGELSTLLPREEFEEGKRVLLLH